MLRTDAKLLLLSDIDAVVTDWFMGYATFMAKKGLPHNGNMPAVFNMTDVFPQLDKPWDHIMEYQEGDMYQYMPFFKDVTATLVTLKHMGVEVHFVTSCGDSDKIKATRDAYMKQHFGGLYEDIHYLGLGADKTEVLSLYSNVGIPTIYIDDQEKMLLPAEKLGYHAVLKDMEYNQDSGDKFERVGGYSDLITIAERLLAPKQGVSLRSFNEGGKTESRACLAPKR